MAAASTGGELPMDEADPALGVTPQKPLNLTRETTNLERVRFDATGGSDGVDASELPTFPMRPSYREFHSALAPASQCVVYDGCPRDPYRPASTPVRRRDRSFADASSENRGEMSDWEMGAIRLRGCLQLFTQCDAARSGVPDHRERNTSRAQMRHCSLCC